MFRELCELGKKPYDLQEDYPSKLVRHIDLAKAYYETGEDKKAESLFQTVFKKLKTIASQDREKLYDALYLNYAVFLRYAKKDINAAIEYYE
jgi:hypothetical protein